MGLSGDEQDRWREVAAELAQERRLVSLSRKLAFVGVGVGLPVRTCLFWLVGGLTGLGILLAGGLSHSHALVIAGVDVLIATVLIAGVLLVVLGVVRGGSHHPGNGRP